MLPRFPKNEVSKLEGAIDRLLTMMSEVDCTSEEYATMTNHLAKLYKMLEIEELLGFKEIEAIAKRREADANCELRNAETALKTRELLNPRRVSPDTLILVAGNLIGIVIILGYEKANIITSRAMNFVMKLR